MAYPFATLPTNMLNGTDTGDETQPLVEGVHAKNENDHARALNDTKDVLGTNPAGNWTTVQERFEQELLSLRSTRSLGLIVHGATASTTRPTTHYAYVWRGTVFPSNLIAGRDFYMPTTSDTVGSGGGGGSAGQEFVNLGNVSGTVSLNMSSRVNTLFVAFPIATTTFTIANWSAGAYAELRVTQPSPTPVTINLPAGQPLVGPMTAPTAAGASGRFGYQYIGAPTGLEIDCWNLGNTAAP